MLVDGDASKGLVLFFPSLEPYVAIGSVVLLDFFCDSGVYGVDPCGQFCFSVVEVVVACFVPVDVKRKAPVYLPPSTGWVLVPLL